MEHIDLNKDGNIVGPSSFNTFGDHYFYNLNPGTFLNQSANTLFDVHFSELLLRKNNLIVVLGTDSGLLPRYIQDKGIPDGSRYIFIEPAPVLAALKANGILDIKNERMLFVDEHTWMDALSSFKVETYVYINRVNFQTALGARANALDIYAQLGWSLSEQLDRIKLQILSKVSNNGFYIEQMRNLADNHHPAMLLKMAFVGKTAFVLGGGPSLDSALPWIKINRNRIALFAVSRIIGSLLKAGIEPDFVVSVDPQKLNFDVSKDMFSLSPKTVLLHAFHVFSGLVRQWHGRSLYLGERISWKSSFNEPNLRITGPTVTNAAIHAAYDFGFNRVFLSGVDYCYTLDGFSHAQGTQEHAAGPRFNLAGIETETYGGYIAPTGFDYNFARDQLEQQVEVMDLQQCQLFNVSSGAAKVKGIEYMPLTSIVLDELPLDIEAILHRCLDGHSDIHSFFSAANTELKRASREIQAIKHLALKAIDYCEHLFDEDGFIKNDKINKNFDKLDLLLKKKHGVINSFVEKFSTRQLVKTQKFLDDDLTSGKDKKEILQFHYKSLLQGAQRISQLLESAKQNLAIREEECKENPDWDRIIEHSRKENDFGRVRIWKTLTGAQHLSEKQKAEFSEFEQIFSDMLRHENTDTTYIAKLKGQSDLSQLKFRAQSLFKHKKVDLLQNLLLAIDKHHDSKGVVPYRFLVKGYLAEIDNQMGLALEFYLSIIQQGDVLLEEALLRTVKIGFHLGTESEMAHQALGHLTQFNPRYFAVYANSHYIRGNIFEAIDNYISYLTIFPDDLLVELKVAELYFEQKNYDGVNIMLDHILKKKPKQETALSIKKQMDMIFKSGKRS